MNYRDDFPIFRREIEGLPIAYLDNAATTQKPASVIAAVKHYYEHSNANAHRGAHLLSSESTERYEAVREKFAALIHARSATEIVFTKGTTEALNLVAFRYGMEHLRAGDEIVLPISEHHSNLIPWQQVAKATGASLRYLYPDENGVLLEADIDEAIGEKTKLVAVAQVSNVLGHINPIAYITQRAHRFGAVVVLDGAQSVPHMPVDVQALDVDFLACSAHKMLGPAGVGVLYGKQHLLAEMAPLLYGGGMVEEVSAETAVFAEPPDRFEGGTQNVEGVIGFGAALDYLAQVGFDEIMRVERQLTQYAYKKLEKVPYIQFYGGTDSPSKTGIITFNIQGVHPHDVATILDSYGVAIRSGHHCAHPLMKHFGVVATCRASFYFYNTTQEIDRLVDGLSTVRGWLKLGS